MLDYTVAGRRYRESAGSNRRDAELAQSKLQSDLTLGKFQIPKRSSSSRSLPDLIKEFTNTKKNTVRKTSLTRYTNYFTPFQSFFEEYFPSISQDVKSIKKTYLLEFINSQLEKKEGDAESKKIWAKKTVNGMIGAIKQLFDYAAKQGYIDDNPFEEIVKYRLVTKGKVEFFTEAELEALWKVLDPYWVDPLRFIANTGLRKGEMINLKWANVNLDADNPQIMITSDEKWQTKSGEARAIPLNKNALDIILRAKGRNAEYVFISKTGLRIHPDQPLRAFKKALKDCNLSGDVHKLRHTFASQLVMKGENLFTVSKLLGHSNTETTQIYAHLSPDHLKNSVTKLKN